ncbi:hypothetical protein M426DRAFT_227588 [Hypoxylon sp. CI-4A]|nr:hypothetical protein M426DRAFT_227588 [Hypoxylon sp. CI-4A]
MESMSKMPQPIPINWRTYSTGSELFPAFPPTEAKKLYSTAPDGFFMCNPHFKKLIDRTIASMTTSPPNTSTQILLSALQNLILQHTPLPAQAPIPLVIATQPTTAVSTTSPSFYQGESASISSPMQFVEHQPDPQQTDWQSSSCGSQVTLCTDQQPPLCAASPTLSEIPSQAYIGICEMYDNNEGLKFGGEKYDMLPFKLKVFRDFCRKAGIGPQQYHETFWAMLKGRARDYYYSNLAWEGMGFEEMVARTTNYFHSSAHQQMYINEWRSTTIETVMEENPEDDLPTCLDKLIERMQRVYEGLSITSLKGLDLSEGIINAVRGHRAFIPILVRPADTFIGLCCELRSIVIAEHLCDMQAARYYACDLFDEDD